MMVSTRSLCLSFLVFLVCFLTLPRLADEEPINSRSSGSRDPSYNEDSHVVLTNPLQAAGVVSPFLAATSSKSQAAVVDEKREEQKVDHQHPLPVLTQHPIVMQPSLADFKEVPVGMPQIKTVTINNPSPLQTLQLTSVSGDTPDFHPSFFQSKVVRSGDSTTFDIVFLPRRVGRVGTVLYIHTSLGTFKYEVYGTSVPNPYRLRAFLGIKMPLNATYSPVISMYNPHSTALQVTEIYSSGGDLHLELLTGQIEGSKSLWEIRPYETKPIIKLNFFGRSINNHTSFIRIRTNYTLEESPIALPVEVIVTQATGIFLSREFIDFGLLKSGDEGKPVPLFLLNAGPGNVHVSSITTVPPNDAIQVIYTPTTLRQSAKYIKIATVLYHVDKVQDVSQHQGKIVVIFEDPSSDILEIPYEATVLQGAMTYEKTQTLFKVGKPPFKAITRNMSLANQFPYPITVYDVRLPAKAQEHFMVNFTKGPYVLYPNMGWQKPFSVTFSPTSSDCQFSTSLRLHTNSSFFTIPLHCYDGKLKYEVKDIDKDSLEYGLMRYTDTISKRFVVININPVKISVTDYKVKGVDYASVELMYVQPSVELQGMMEMGNAATVYRPHRTPFTIDVGHEAVFEVNITKPDIKGRHEGEILVKTSLGKELHIPVFYKVVLGTLQVEPEVVLLSHAHPFTMVNTSFSVWSFFNQPVKVISVQPNPPNPQFYYVPPEAGNPLLLSEKMTQMGTIVFDPSKGDWLSTKPYLGLDQDDGRSSINSWVNSLNGISNQRVAENDARDYKLIRGLWSKIKMKRIQASLILETDMSSNYEIHVEAQLHWPSLLSNTTISFPTTLLGNTSVQHVAVNNPTNQPLLVQALMLAVYPNPDSVLRLLKGQYSFNTSIFDSSDLTTFYLPDSEAFENVFPTDMPQQENHHEATRLTVAHSPLTVTSLIPPQSSAVVRVAFSPKVEKNFTSLLLLRSNLTILDALMVHGYGVAVQLLFGGKEPGAPLMFEYTEASLIQCHKELAAANSLRLVKTFTMRNIGQLPLHVLSMDFGSYGCTDYGFVVENCTTDFVLEPNATKDVRVSFTPDFTMSRIQRTLILHMTHSTELAFTLLATLPHSLLPLCYAALPRLDIEKLLSKITAVFMILLLVVVVMMAIYSAQFNNICQYYELDLLRHGTSVFDLNNLTEDGYISHSDTTAGTQVETVRPGKSSNLYSEASAVPKNSQESTATTSFQEPPSNTNTAARLKAPLDDPEANASHKSLQNIVDHSSANHTTANSNSSGLSQRSRDNSQSMDEADGSSGNSTVELTNNNDMQLVSSRSSKPVAAVAGTSRSSPSKSTSKADNFTSPSIVAVTDSSSQTPPLSNSQTTSESPTVDAPTYSKRSKLSKKQSSKSLKQQNTEVASARKSEVKDKTKLEKESVEKEASHEQVVVKEKSRDKVKPFTKDAGTGQAIPVEDAPQDGGVEAEDDVEDNGKKEVSMKGKDKRKKVRAQPKREEKESKKKRDRELEMAEFIKNKRLSSESIEVESTTSTENLDDENPNGEPDEKPTKAATAPPDNKEVVCSESNRPNDSPTGQSAPPEEEITKETAQPNPKTNDKKTLKLTEIYTDPFSRKPDKTSYTSKKIVGVSKKQSTERTKSASSEEPDDSKPTTPVGGAKPRAKNKQIDGDVSSKNEEQEAKSPDSKAEGIRLTSPHDIAASLLSKNTIIATRSKMKVEREAKEANKYDLHSNAKISPLAKPNDMMMPEDNYLMMQGNMPHHPHHYPSDFNRPDHGGVLSLNAEPFVPTVGAKEHSYYPEEPRPMNRMEVSRLQTGKTLGDFMPPSVTQPSRHYHPKKHQDNMYSDHHKGMFEDPRMLRSSHHMMHHHPQQKVSPTMIDDSQPHHMYHHSMGYHSDRMHSDRMHSDRIHSDRMHSDRMHSDRMGHDPHFSHHRSSLDHSETFFEEDYSGLQSFDQQLCARNSRPSNLPYNTDDSVPFYSAGSHNIISASSGRKGMNMGGGGLTLTSPTSMFESPKKQQFPGYPRPVGVNSTMSSSDDNIPPGYSRQHYLHTLQHRRVGKQPQRLPPPGLGDPQFGEVIQDRGGGIPWGIEEFGGNESGSLQLQQQLLRRQQLLLQQQQQQSFDLDDYGEIPNLHSTTSPVFPTSSLNLAPGSGFSSAVHEPRPPPLDLGWDTGVSSNRSDKYMSDMSWGNSSSAVGDNSSVSMLWRQGSSHNSRNQSLSSMSDTNSTDFPKFTGNMYGLFDGPGSIWDPAAGTGNSSLLPWATTPSPSENKDNSTN